MFDIFSRSVSSVDYLKHTHQAIGLSHVSLGFLLLFIIYELPSFWWRPIIIYPVQRNLLDKKKEFLLKKAISKTTVINSVLWSIKHHQNDSYRASNLCHGHIHGGCFGSTEYDHRRSVRFSAKCSELNRTMARTTQASKCWRQKIEILAIWRCRILTITSIV